MYSCKTADSKKGNVSRSFSLLTVIFLSLSAIPPSLADSSAPRADQYADQKRRALESLTGRAVASLLRLIPIEPLAIGGSA